jgi:hypothetical protein
MGNKRPHPGTMDQLDLFACERKPSPPSTAKPTGLAAAIQPPRPAQTPNADLPRVRLTRAGPHDIADKIADTWHAQHLGNDIIIPMGTVAGLALLSQTAADGKDVARHVLSLDPTALITFHREVWGHTWLRHPYLASCSYDLWNWLLRDDLPAKVTGTVHAVTRTAIKAGLIDVTGAPDPAWRCEHDTLGALLAALRSHGKRDALGEFHTPPEVATLLTRMAVLEPPGPGESFDDPTAGTGGLLRAAALALRLQGLDPHDYVWSMGDIDPIAAACCAVNALVWDLGPNVLVFCGDTLQTGDGPKRAAKRRKDMLDHHDRLMSRLAVAQALGKTHRLVMQLLNAS